MVTMYFQGWNLVGGDAVTSNSELVAVLKILEGRFYKLAYKIEL